MKFPTAVTAWLAAQNAEAWDRASNEMRTKYDLVLPAPPERDAAAAIARTKGKP